MKLKFGVKRLPSYVLDGAKPISRFRSSAFKMKIDQDCITEYIGVRRFNEGCLEVFSGARSIKSAYGSAVGVLFLMGVVCDVIIFNVLPGPYSAEILFSFFIFQ